MVTWSQNPESKKLNYYVHIVFILLYKASFGSLFGYKIMCTLFVPFVQW